MDNFAMKGIRRSLCNRAYYDSKALLDSTADLLKRLLALGLEIVDMTHTSTFAIIEHPTQSVDGYEVPFNPRGDGYQIPAGSSDGSATAVAAYEWLDLAVGTDSKWCGG